MSLALTLGAGLLLSCTAVVLGSRFGAKYNRYPLPPGPQGLPLLGNVLQMPTSREWITFAAWGKAFGKTYIQICCTAANLEAGIGGVVHVSVFGRPIIVLNSRKAINDLLENKSGIYSDRPVLPMAGELYVPKAFEISFLIVKQTEWGTMHPCL